MINFFRKIRKKLADDNQFLKYSRYAIGEIVLVVIGILIALQINTWNEERKTSNLEKETLKEIVENLDDIEQDLLEAIELTDHLNSYTDSIIHLIETRIYDPDLLERSIHKAFLGGHYGVQIKNVGFETLKNRGVDIISNQELRKRILFLYEDSYANLDRTFQWNFSDEVNPYKNRHFSPTSGGDRILYRANDYGFVISDPYFNSLVRHNNIQRRYFKRVMAATLEDTQKVKEMIQKEINPNDSVLP